MAMEARIREFFKEYEARFNRALKGEEDAEGTANTFTDCFIGASPQGVMCGANNEEFRQNIPRGNAWYRSIGTKLMNITSIETTTIDDMHFMVRAAWHSEYVTKKEEEIKIDFEVVYLLQFRNEQLKIFAYITGDEQAALRQHGVID